MQRAQIDEARIHRKVTSTSKATLHTAVARTGHATLVVRSTEGINLVAIVGPHDGITHDHIAIIRHTDTALRPEEVGAHIGHHGAAVKGHDGACAVRKRAATTRPSEVVRDHATPQRDLRFAAVHAPCESAVVEAAAIPAIVHDAAIFDRQARATRSEHRSTVVVETIAGRKAPTTAIGESEACEHRAQRFALIATHDAGGKVAAIEDGHLGAVCGAHFQALALELKDLLVGAGMHQDAVTRHSSINRGLNALTGRYVVIGCGGRGGSQEGQCYHRESTDHAGSRC